MKKRILSFVLALTMLLPMISVPVFSEETEESVVEGGLNYSEDFSDAVEPADVLASYPASTSILDGALRVEYAAYDNGILYAMENRNTSFEISNAVVEGDMLTGTVAISGVVYDIAGQIFDTRDATSAATLTRDGEAYTDKILYIYTSKVCDSFRGGFNVGVPMNLKTPAFSAENYSKVSLRAEYFFSEELADAATFAVSFGASTGRIALACFSIQEGCVVMDRHPDADHVYEEGTSLVAPTGRWVEFRADLDLQDGTVMLFLNNEYAMTIEDTELCSGLPANALNLLQIERACTPADPAEMTGYVLIDNVTLTDANKVYYSNDFEMYEGVDSSDILNGPYTYNFGRCTTFPSKAQVLSEDGNTYIRYNYGADIAGTAYDVDYYAYSGYTKWEFNEMIDYYDHENCILFLTDGTSYSVSPPSEANVALGYYGDFRYDGMTYILSSGAYAASNKFGDNNVDKGINLRIPPMTYEDYSEIYISARYMIEPGSSGTCEIQFRAIGTRNFPPLGLINLSTGLFTCGSTVIAQLPIGEWFTIGMQIDMIGGGVRYSVTSARSTIIGVVGTDLGDNLTIYRGTAPYTTAQLIIAKHNKGGNPAGSISVDDVFVGDCSYAPVADSYRTFYDFEDQTVGSAPVGVFSPIGNANTAVDDSKGSKAWRVEYVNVGSSNANDDGDLNIDKNPMVIHGALSHENGKTVVFEADYFIEEGSTGRLQSQLKMVTSNGTTYPWNDFYTLAGTTSDTWVISREAGSSHGSAQIPLGQWFTVSAELDLETGYLKVFLNNVRVIDSWLYIQDSSMRQYLEINANQWIVGKANKILGSGVFYVDNLEVFYGNVEEHFHSFEQVSYTEPGCYTDGSIVYECTSCGATKQETLYSTHHVTVDTTGVEDAISLSNDAVYPYSLVDGKYISTNNVDCTSATFEITALEDCTLELLVGVVDDGYELELRIERGDWYTDYVYGGSNEKTTFLKLFEGETVRLTTNCWGYDNSGYAYFSILPGESKRVPANRVEATCTEDVVCEDCKDIVRWAEHQWNWSDGTVVTPPTHETSGVCRYSCYRCDATYDEEIYPTGHNWDQGTVLVEVNCTEDGSVLYTCDCGASRTDVIPAYGHSADLSRLFTVTNESSYPFVYSDRTFLSSSNVEYYSSVLSLTALRNGCVRLSIGLRNSCCDSMTVYRNGILICQIYDYGSDVIDVFFAAGDVLTIEYRKDHNAYDYYDGETAVLNEGYVSIEVLSDVYFGDCTEDVVCVDCGTTLKKANGHEWDEGRVTLYQDCDTDGIRTYTCKCGETRSETIPAGHYVTVSTEKTHQAFELENVLGSPFDLADGVYTSTNHGDGSSSTFEITVLYDCTIEIVYGVSSESGYDWLTVAVNGEQIDRISGVEEGRISRVAMEGDVLTFTYSKDGSVDEYSDCAYLQILSDPTVVTGGTERVPAQSICESCGDCVSCEGCGTVVSSEIEHQWQGVVTVEPTVTEEGLMTYTCLACGETRTETIPVLTCLGDVNGDEAVTNADVLLIFRYIYNGETYALENPVAADVDGDGAVTNADVLLIFRYIYNPTLYPLQ